MTIGRTHDGPGSRRSAEQPDEKGIVPAATAMAASMTVSVAPTMAATVTALIGWVVA